MIFRMSAQCIACHAGPELSDATVSFAKLNGLRNADGGDQGFHNIGVAPVTASRVEDIGRAGWAERRVVLAERLQRRSRRVQDAVAAQREAHRAVLPQRQQGHAAGRGPLLRERRRLPAHVVAAQPDRPHRARAALVDFLENALTDCRVERAKAPFDHPSLAVPDGRRSRPSAATAPARGRGPRGPRSKKCRSLRSDARPAGQGWARPSDAWPAGQGWHDRRTHGPRAAARPLACVASASEALRRLRPPRRVGVEGGSATPASSPHATTDRAQLERRVVERCPRSGEVRELHRGRSACAASRQASATSGARMARGSRGIDRGRPRIARRDGVNGGSSGNHEACRRAHGAARVDDHQLARLPGRAPVARGARRWPRRGGVDRAGPVEARVARRAVGRRQDPDPARRWPARPTAARCARNSARCAEGVGRARSRCACSTRPARSRASRRSRAPGSARAPPPPGPTARRARAPPRCGRARRAATDRPPTPARPGAR